MREALELGRGETRKPVKLFKKLSRWFTTEIWKEGTYKRCKKKLIPIDSTVNGGPEMLELTVSFPGDFVNGDVLNRDGRRHRKGTVWPFVLDSEFNVLPIGYLWCPPFFSMSLALR